MIARAAGAVLDWWAARRRHTLAQVWRRPDGVQEQSLLRLITAARDTEFGLAHGFAGIRSIAEYQERVQAVNAKAADVYRYMNFDQIAAFKEVADTVTV